MVFRFALWLILLKIIENTIYVSLFVLSFRKKEHFGIRMFLFWMSIICFMTAASASVYAMVAHDLFYNSIFMLGFNSLLDIALLMVLTLLIEQIFQESFPCVAFAVTVGACETTITRAIYDIFLAVSGKFSVYVAVIDRPDVVSVLFYLLLHAVMITICYRMFAERFGKMAKKFDHAIDKYITLIYVLFLLSRFVLNDNTANTLSSSPNMKIVFSSACLLYGLMVMFIERFIMYWILDIQEKNAVKNHYAAYRRETEALQKNMEMVNIKCHDLKHQIRRLLKENNAGDDFLKEVQETIAIYDTNIQTGNPEIDVVLQEKALQCDVNHIEMTCMLEGGSLSAMSPGDISSLFGNALDNAIEYLLKIEDTEKRYIRISSHRQFDILVIRIENYCEDDPIFEDDMPSTTKQDKGNHGFGTRSMKNIVEKYGGLITWQKENSMIVVQIVFPNVPSVQTDQKIE